MKQKRKGAQHALRVAATAALFSVFSLTACGGGGSSGSGTLSPAPTPAPAPSPPAPVVGVETPSQISVVTAK